MATVAMSGMYLFMKVIMVITRFNSCTMIDIFYFSSTIDDRSNIKNYMVKCVSSLDWEGTMDGRYADVKPQTEDQIPTAHGPF